MDKAVSVVVPCYCIKDEYFDGLIKSLLNQTLGEKKLEIVLVDDGSPDDTYKKLLQYEQGAPETIMVIHCSENGGPGSARTIGLSYATGEYVAFADQDDWVDLGMYQILYENGKRFDCDVVKCGWCREQNLYEPQMTEVREDGVLYEIYSKADRQKLLDDLDLGGYWAAIYRRTMLLENDIFFPAGLFYDDNFFSGLVPYYGNRYYFCREKMYHWFVNPQSVSMGSLLSRQLNQSEVELLLLEEVKKRGLLAEYPNFEEAAFFERYFLNTVATLIVRQGSMPLSLWELMCQQLISHFPHFDKNPIIRKKYYHLFPKSWMVIIRCAVMDEIPGLWDDDCWPKEYEELKEYSFIDLIYRKHLTQSQWEMVQYTYMMLVKLKTRYR